MIKECTKENPYTLERAGKGIQFRHANAREVGEQESGWPAGDIVEYKCDDCGITWKQELPQ